MRTPTQEEQLVDAFVTLADTLVIGYDVVDLLQTLVETCHDLLDISAAGILLADSAGELEVVASTSEASNLIEVMQVDAQEGPCMDCFHTGQPVSLPDVDVDSDHWPQFRAKARELDFGGVFAVPLRLREQVIGTLNLLRQDRGDIPPRDLRAAQALADVATIGILHERSLRDSHVVRDQLQSALDSRVVIEQAKGYVAHNNDISPEDAFLLIRTYSRNNGLRLSDVAHRLVEQSLTL